MLTRFVRTQLVIFTLAAIIGVRGDDLRLPAGADAAGHRPDDRHRGVAAPGGLYRFCNVTYRGVQVGKVTDSRLTASGAEATLSLDDSPKIPADLQAEVRSVSAVGEQYVDLRPRTDRGPFLHDGSVIALRHTSVPQQVGPMLDRVNALIASIPKDRLGDLLDESFKALQRRRRDLGSLLDSSSRITGDLNGVADQSRTLIEDTAPLLDTQVATTDAHADVGAQPGRRHRPAGHERPAGAHAVGRTGPGRRRSGAAAATRSSRPCRYCWPTSPRSARSP